MPGPAVLDPGRGFLAGPRYVDVVRTTPGLMAYWPLSESSGTVAQDLIGTNPAAYAGGDKLAQPGPNGEPAVRVDGVSGSRIRATSISFPANLSWEIWVNAVTWLNSGAIGQWASAGGSKGSFIYMSSSGGISMYCNGTNTPFWQSVLATQYHFVATYDGTSLRLYANGTLRGGPTASAAPTATAAPLDMGAYDNNTGTFNGRLARGAYYSRALTANEIQTHYYAGIGA